METTQAAGRAPAYADVGKALGTDYFLLRDQLSEQEIDYLERTRRFVDELPKGPTGKILKREIEVPQSVKS